MSIYYWISFNLFILILLGFDLWRFYLHPQPRSFKESILTCIGWVSLALLFNGWIYWALGSEPALNFFTGYLLEESLSIDNLFVFLLIFTQFRVPASCKHFILFLGVIGAIIMRGLLIWAGIAFVSHFTWAFYLLGAFLVYTGVQLALKKIGTVEIQNTRIYKIFNRYVEMTPYFHGTAFFIKRGYKTIATPLLLVLILIETTDLVFALDSVPAILGITTDPFIVYTSNVFAILGLRSFFFVLKDIMWRFHYVHDAVAAMLVFIGFKMLIKHFYEIPTGASLGVIAFLLSGAIILSLVLPQKKQ